MRTHNSAISVLTIVLISVGGNVVSADYDCEAAFDRAEQCFQQLMIIGKQMDFNKATFQAICQTEFDAVGCIQEYKTNCVKGMASMVFNLLNKKFNQTFNHLCKDNDAMDEFLEHYNCIKDSLRSDQAKLCTDQYHLRLEMIDQVDKNDRFPIICCSFYEIKECIGKELRQSCKNENSISYFNDLTTKFIGQLQTMVCADWKDLEVCRAKLPPPLAESFTKISAMDLATAENSKKIKSFLRLLKHLIDVAST